MNSPHGKLDVVHGSVGGRTTMKGLGFIAGALCVLAGVVASDELITQSKETPRQVNRGLSDEIEHLIRELGDDHFATREAATKRLAEIGAPALGALRRAVKSEDG